VKSALRITELPGGIVPKLSGRVGDVNVPSGKVIAVTWTFSAAAVPLLRIPKADKSVVGFSKLTPGGPADRTTGEATHSTLTVKKLPGLEASLIVS
jgi:hypothetical protein